MQLQARAVLLAVLQPSLLLCTVAPCLIAVCTNASSNAELLVAQRELNWHRAAEVASVSDILEGVTSLSEFSVMNHY